MVIKLYKNYRSIHGSFLGCFVFGRAVQLEKGCTRLNLSHLICCFFCESWQIFSFSVVDSKQKVSTEWVSNPCPRVDRQRTREQKHTKSDESTRTQPFSNCTTRQNTKHWRQLFWANTPEKAAMNVYIIFI